MTCVESSNEEEEEQEREEEGEEEEVHEYGGLAVKHSALHLIRPSLHLLSAETVSRAQLEPEP